MGFLIVFLGGGTGAAARHGVNLLAARLVGTAFPYGTLFINVTGSLAMGLLAGYFAFKAGIPQHWRLFLTTGVLGGYTIRVCLSRACDWGAICRAGDHPLADLTACASLSP